MIWTSGESFPGGSALAEASLTPPYNYMTAEPNTADVSQLRATKTRRSWRQFSLRTLLLVMLVLSVCLALFAWRLQRARKQAAAVATIRKLGGTVGYDYQYPQYRESLDRIGLGDLSKGDSAVPPLLLKWLGTDFFHDVQLIHCGSNAGSEHDLKEWWGAVAVLTKAKEIDARGSWVSGRMTTEAIRRHRDLRFLALVSGRLSGNDLEPLARLTELEFLGLQDNQIDDDGISQVASLAKLKRLQMDNNPITDNGAVHLEKMRQLTNLHLSGTLIGDDSMPAIGTLNKLEVLSLGDTALSDKGIVHLKELANLRRLSVAKTNITDRGLASLQALAALENLHISDTQINGSGFRELQSLTKLRTVSIGRLPISDEGASWICRLPELRKIAFGPGISSEAFATLEWSASLYEVSLLDSEVTDEGLMRLVACPNLRKVSVNRTRVSPEAVKQFQQARPTVVVSGP